MMEAKDECSAVAACTQGSKSLAPFCLSVCLSTCALRSPPPGFTLSNPAIPSGQPVRGHLIIDLQKKNIVCLMRGLLISDTVVASPHCVWKTVPSQDSIVRNPPCPCQQPQTRQVYKPCGTNLEALACLSATRKIPYSDFACTLSCAARGGKTWNCRNKYKIQIEANIYICGVLP